MRAPDGEWTTEVVRTRARRVLPGAAARGHRRARRPGMDADRADQALTVDQVRELLGEDAFVTLR